MSEHKHPLRNLEQLRSRVQAHSQAVTQAHPTQFACRKGCSGCCATERRVNDLEFQALKQGYDALDVATRSTLQSAPEEGPCPLLIQDACALYEERPLICRSHGLPIVMENQLDVCPLNFEGVDLETLAETDLLSVDTLTAILTVSNMLFCSETGGDPERRRPVSALWAKAPEAG